MDSGLRTKTRIRVQPYGVHRVYHFSPAYTYTRQESSGVLRAEGNLLRPRILAACALGSCESGPVRTLPVPALIKS
jgi:hypothetical protein